MSNDKPNQHFVMAVFENEDAAKAAITNLEGWDIARQDVSLGSIGTIYKKNGKVKTDMGRKTGTGAKVGAVLGVAGALLGPVGLIGGLLAGALVGAGAGSIFTEHMQLTEDEVAQLNKDLDEGRVAVVVACDEYEMDGAAINLRESGGNVITFSVPQAELQAAAPEAEQAAAADTDEA
ncbi:MAG: DUF1269 domain-containing protein [Caldilineales bacterium]